MPLLRSFPSRAIRPPRWMSTLPLKRSLLSSEITALPETAAASSIRSFLSASAGEEQVGKGGGAIAAERMLPLMEVIFATFHMHVNARVASMCGEVRCLLLRSSMFPFFVFICVFSSLFSLAHSLTSDERGSTPSGRAARRTSPPRLSLSTPTGTPRRSTTGTSASAFTGTGRSPPAPPSLAPRSLPAFSTEREGIQCPLEIPFPGATTALSVAVPSTF